MFCFLYGFLVLFQRTIVLVNRPDVPPSSVAVERMGGRTKTQIRGVTPVLQVMTGTEFPAVGKIRDFIMDKALFLEESGS